MIATLISVYSTQNKAYVQFGPEGLKNNRYFLHVSRFGTQGRSPLSHADSHGPAFIDSAEAAAPWYAVSVAVLQTLRERGALVAVALTIPVVNIGVPLLAAAAFTHLFHLLSAGTGRNSGHRRG